MEKRIIFLNSDNEEVSLSYSIEDEKYPKFEKNTRGETIIGSLFIKYNLKEKKIEICSMNQIDSKVKNLPIIKNMAIRKTKSWVQKLITAFNQKRIKKS